MSENLAPLTALAPAKTTRTVSGRLETVTITQRVACLAEQCLAPRITLPRVRTPQGRYSWVTNAAVCAGRVAGSVALRRGTIG